MVPFRFKSLQSRLLFFFLSLFLGVGFLAFLAMTSIHEPAARNQIETELKLGASVVDTMISVRLEAHRSAASILSKDYAFQQAFSTGDMGTVSSAMESLLLRTKADLIMLLSNEDSHTVLVDIPRTGLASQPFPYPDLLVKAEETLKPQTAFIHLGGQLYSVTVVPILAPEPLAWFCIGFRVDNKFLKDLQKVVPSDMSVVELKTGATPLMWASTLPQTNQETLAPKVPRIVLDQGVSVATIGRDRFLFQSAPLERKTHTWLIIQHSLEEVLQPFYFLQSLLLIIGLIGFLITYAGAVVISRSVSRPVRELAEKSREVAKGIYDQQVVIDLEDEIGELATSFNQMTAGLADRDRIRDMLGKVVSPAIAEELLKSKELVLGGEEKEVTILFSDIRDFTTLCEGRAPTEILKTLNQYLTRMNDIIDANGGVVDKFIGDAIMAIFGTPIHHQDDPDRAMSTALTMVRELENINLELALRKFPPLKIGIGINTDVIVAGNMGSRNRLNYTVIGDGVNLASRLESECKKFHRTIIISEKTLKKAKNAYKTEFLGEVTVKGKSEPTRIFALLGEEGELPQEERTS